MGQTIQHPTLLLTTKPLAMLNVDISNSAVMTLRWRPDRHLQGKDFKTEHQYHWYLLLILYSTYSFLAH